jgi:hypothetical protein
MELARILEIRSGFNCGGELPGIQNDAIMSIQGIKFIKRATEVTTSII